MMNIGMKIQKGGGRYIKDEVSFILFEEAIEYVSNGYKSLIAEDTTYDAEGLVLKTDLGLLDRSGQRIIAKIKARDFWWVRN